jgi:hypothetical protein
MLRWVPGGSVLASDLIFQPDGKAGLADRFTATSAAARVLFIARLTADGDGSGDACDSDDDGSFADIDDGDAIAIVASIGAVSHAGGMREYSASVTVNDAVDGGFGTDTCYPGSGNNTVVACELP